MNYTTSTTRERLVQNDSERRRQRGSGGGCVCIHSLCLRWFAAPQNLLFAFEHDSFALTQTAECAYLDG